MTRIGWRSGPFRAIVVGVVFAIVGQIAVSSLDDAATAHRQGHDVATVKVQTPPRPR
jgi:hypothetical protein